MHKGYSDGLLTVDDLTREFGLTTARVRAWIAAGSLVPVRREGRGRGGAMLFARGDVLRLVCGICAMCGGGFVRAKLGQEFCGRPCRDRYRRTVARA